MRITNKIMQSNSVTNINNNKLLQDKLNTQMSTQRKISRPSDDPVIAIRALRLRTNLAEITQYYEKNVPDAQSWMKVTEDAVDTVADVLSNMYKQCQKGSDDALNSENRAAILKDLKALRDEVYATGDADYEGRSIFTGFRTESKLLFQTNEKVPYRITEQLNPKSISTIKYVNTGSLANVNEGNFNTPGATTEQGVQESEVNRIRLSYDTLSQATAATPNPALMVATVAPDGTKTYAPLQVGGANVKIVPMSSTTLPSPYEQINAPGNEDTVIFVPETGEMLLGSRVTAAIQSLPADTELTASYEKEQWDKGDLRPEHYFNCQKNPATVPPTPGAPKEVRYNDDYLKGNVQDDGKQIISYTVGFNQTIQVNTLASECFTHDIGRDVDELLNASQAVLDMEAAIKRLTSMKGNTKYDQVQVEARLDAANKAHTLLIEKERKLYSAGMTAMKAYQGRTTLAETNIGSRGARLDLVKNRLQEQQSNFKELTASNEGIEITEVAVELESATMSYNAALMATGKIIQNSLMDFI
ncbi:MAG: hypothetical protein RRX92_05825 [Lachnospiraceae bacterium]